MPATTQASSTPIRVLIADDHPMMREGIVQALDAEGGIEIAGLAAGGADAIELYSRERPDVAVIDLQMPGTDGLAAIRAIRGLDPDARLIVVSTWRGDARIAGALQAGARAFVTKEASGAELAGTIRAVHAGSYTLPSSIAAEIDAFHAGEVPSARELDVLRLVACGRSNREIAALLGIGESTVKSHVASMLAKLVERERIARALHDTILQSVQAPMLRLDALSARLPQGDATRASLDTMLRDAGDAIGAGRDQVRELRVAAVPSLEEIARAGAAELQALHPQVGFELDMAGPARDLLPAVADEAGHIVLEAMRNAFTHARPRRIAVRVDHGRRTLSVAVADDGCGMDADVARDGYRSGHWGLIGMRERATRIGGQLDIASRSGQGTTITLTVPAARAYA